MYLNFAEFSVDFQPEKQMFDIISGDPGIGAFVRNAEIHAETLEHQALSESDFKTFKDDSELNLESLTWKRTYSGGPVATPELIIGFQLRSDRVRFFCGGRAYVNVSGFFRWGGDAEHSTFSVRMDSQEPRLRTASGPAVFPGDNALFNRLTDRLLIYSSAGSIRSCFDWEKRTYAFHYINGIDFGRELEFRIRRNYCADKFHVPYSPINKKHGFKTPPVGWMTWYAVQFAASEKTVMENAWKFLELFGKYTEKPVLWVDWEWCHQCWDGQGEINSDIFHPRKAAYPNGLKAVAEQLREVGLIPALWIGASNEGRLNQMLAEHPDWVLGRMVLWCGQWWIDPSHPGVLNEYIPAVFRRILDWGFQAVKWDCLPGTIQACSEMHDRFYDRSVTPAEGFRNMVKAARGVLGNEVYMLSCAGDSERDICGAMDLFNAARIGGDIFSWDDFLEQGINRVLHAYPWHNTILYVDADNLILRPELSNLEQARTRVSFYGLTGLPVTLGDELSTLDSERVHMLRRIMPVTDIHPSELDSKRHGPYLQITNLSIARPFGKWNVVGAANLTSERRNARLDFRKDLDLDPARYAVYDYWNGVFLGIYSHDFEFELNPFDTKVFRITPLEGEHPVLISISRHLTQGGYELSDLSTSESEMSGTVLCIAGEPCIVTVLLHENCGEIHATHAVSRIGRTALIELLSSSGGPVSWRLNMERNE